MTNWFVKRLQSMSLLEVFYRAGQFIQKVREKNNRKIFHQPQDYNRVFSDALINHEAKTLIPLEFIKQFRNYNSFEFFGYSIDLDQSIDWHLDIQSSKRFPLEFSKDINIRSGENGNAKMVWEVNRLQFLLPLAAKYLLTGEKTDIDRWMSIMKSWVNSNPYMEGVNWYSNIEVNIRLCVWHFCWQILLTDEDLKKNQEFVQFTKDIWLPTIYDHCIYSIHNPSRFSSANNHLVAEYCGLFVAAVTWPFKDAEHWSIYAQKGLEEEIIRQHSENGINKEEASEYIQFITDFFLIPFAVGKKQNIIFSQIYQSYLKRIFEYINTLLDVKGGYAKYGDEDDGKVIIVSGDPHFNNFLSILVSGAVLFDDCKLKRNDTSFDFKNWLFWGNDGEIAYERLIKDSSVSSSVFYPNEGHFFFRKKDSEHPDKETYLHFDVAPLGFLSIAAHGHADALSIALTLDGNPILIDPGTYTYHTEKEWRKYFVSTLAHNTICIDGANQAQYIGPTMWMRHYATQTLKVTQTVENERVSASHDGYKSIRCMVNRIVDFERSANKFIISDIIRSNRSNHLIYQPWHLHPMVKIIPLDTHSFFLQHISGNRKIKMTCDEKVSIIEIRSGDLNPLMGWYSSSFMKREPTQVLFGSLEIKPLEKVNLITLIEII